MCRSASLPAHKLSNFLLVLKTPASSFFIWFLVKLLQKGYMMDFSEAFWNASQSENKNHLASGPVLTKVINYKTLRSGGWIETKPILHLRFTSYLQECQLRVVLEDFSWYPLIWFSFKILRQDSHNIYNDFTTLSLQFVLIFPSLLSFFRQFCVGFIALLWKLTEKKCTSVNY